MVKSERQSQPHQQSSRIRTLSVSHWVKRRGELHPTELPATQNMHWKAKLATALTAQLPPTPPFKSDITWSSWSRLTLRSSPCCRRSAGSNYSGQAEAAKHRSLMVMRTPMSFMRNYWRWGRLDEGLNSLTTFRILPNSSFLGFSRSQRRHHLLATKQIEASLNYREQLEPASGCWQQDVLRLWAASGVLFKAKL